MRYNQNVVVNPTTIDTNRHNPLQFPGLRKKGVVTIGWTGTHSTLPYLGLIYPAMKTIEEKYSQVRILVIADQMPAFHLPAMTFIPWNKASEVSDLMQIDIGIMPLPDDAWTQGKCGLKILQFLALEIPTVASPVGINTEIIQVGENGFLARNQQEWIDHLSFLIDHEAGRLQMGKTGRQTVLKHYSVDSNSANFLSLFD